VEFSGLTERALAVRQGYEEYERRTYGRPWSLEELTLGLVGDVGDLAKLVQAREGVRAVDDAEARLEHELADVLWSVMVIAARCGVDLEAAFVGTVDELTDWLARAKELDEGGV
jgi:NTP pyrophosphatase (non-canonical NTP hydrolase)